jgi:hypothetical protein
MVTFTIDMVEVGKIAFLLYAMGMAGFFGYMIGSSRGFSEGMNSMKKIYGK